MDTKIVTPTMEKEKEPTTQTLNELKKMNEQLVTKDGEWVYSNEHGIVWAPTFGDEMGGGTPTPNPTTPPSLLGELIRWGNTLDLDAVKPNSVMVIKLSSQNSVHAQRMQQGIVSMVLAPRAEKLKDKRLTVLFMASDDDISLLEESEMEEAGWQKKEKSLIISPFKR